MKSEELTTLLVAAEVRKLAIELRTQARATALSGWASGHPEIADGPPIAYTEEERKQEANLASQRQSRTQDRATFLQAWDKNQPLSSFMVQAIEELESVAKLITDQPSWH